MSIPHRILEFKLRQTLLASILCGKFRDNYSRGILCLNEKHHTEDDKFGCSMELIVQREEVVMQAW